MRTHTHTHEPPRSEYEGGTLGGIHGAQETW